VQVKEGHVKQVCEFRYEACEARVCC